MPHKPPRACRCGQLISAGQRCQRCYPPWATRPTTWAGGSTRRWRRLRAAKLTADPLCQWPECVRLADEVDHIVPLSEDGDRWSWSNLQSLCTPHHAEKTRAEALRARHHRGGARRDDD
ncbi:HNH endonuclease signature motif containing protein [Actinophytocola sediminis]